MEHSHASSERRQPVVLLDVGGQSFKISQQSLNRYPNSLLSKVANEFPELIDKGESLYIDRNPKMFSWILEIYRYNRPCMAAHLICTLTRDGDYASCIPSVQSEFLQKELDFYQLPNMESLYHTQHLPVVFSKQRTKRELMIQVLQEIEASGLRSMFSWDLYIYFIVVRSHPHHQRRICVRVPRGMRTHSAYYNEGEHSDFFAAMQCRNGSPCHLNGQIIYPSSTSGSNYAVPLNISDIVQLLYDPASEHGMQAVTHSYNQPMDEGDAIIVNCVRLHYASE